MKNEEIIQKARDLIIQHAGHDGEHHKDWCIDQVFRILVGDEYSKIVSAIEQDGYSWNEGIAP